jgi:cytochrome c5
MMTVVSACAGQQLPEAGTADVELFKKKCTTCHSWPHPARHTKEEWDHYLPLMETHMKKRGVPFPPEEKQIIRNYLHRNAR